MRTVSDAVSLATCFCMCGAKSLMWWCHVQGGIAQGQNETAPHTKEQRALTKCYFTLASKAPSALVPFLEVIAQRTISLVDSGVLGYADKNVICEGLLLSAARDGPDLFGRVVSALISPIRASWEKLIEQLPNAEGLMGVMLTPVTAGQNGMAHIGGNDSRSFVYYSLQLLLFCARQAKSCEGAGGYEVCLQLRHVCSCSFQL